MPWGKRLHCQDCNHVWDVVLMRRTDANPPCPVCQAAPQETLAAPRINTGAQQELQLKIPENKTKAIDTAMRWASEDNGGVNIRTDARPGESVAVPVPQDPRTANLTGFVGGNGMAGSLNLGTLAEIRGRIPNEDKARNLSLLGGIQKRGATPLNVVAASSMKAK